MDTQKLFGGKNNMKKYSWIVALLLALLFTNLFISCGENFDATKLDAEPWEIDAKDIKLEEIGSNPGAKADGNTFTNKAGGGASSTGFAWKPPAGKNEAGFVWTDFEKVRVTIKIVELKQPAAGVSYNAKTDRSMGTDVNRFGETKQYANATVVVGGKGDEAYADYPVAKFKDSGEIAFQYNCWEGNSDIVAGGGRTEPNHKIEVSFTFFTKMKGEVPFEPVTKIELVTTTGNDYVDFKLEAKITPEKATNQEVIWAIFPKDATEGSGTSMITSKTDMTIVDFKQIPTTDINYVDVEDTWEWPWVNTTDKVPVTNEGRNGRYLNIILAEEGLGATDPDGTVEIVAVIKDGKGPGEDFIQRGLIVKIKPNPVAVIEFNEAVSVSGGNQWQINPVSNFSTGTKYFVIAFYTGPDGIKLGNMSLSFNHGTSYTKPEYFVSRSGDPKSIDKADANGVVYLVFDLSKFDTYDDVIGDGDFGWGLQLCMYNGFSDLGPSYKGFLVNDDVTLVKPAGSVDFDDPVGYIASSLPGGLTVKP
jgi:hypothetical protein